MFLVVYNQTGSELGGQIDRDIASDTAQLSQSLSSAGQDNPTQIATVARHYMLGQPYTATSTLLFVLIGGAALLQQPKTHAARLLAEQGVTRLDILEYISHGVTKTPIVETPEEEESDAVAGDGEEGSSTARDSA